MVFKNFSVTFTSEVELKWTTVRPGIEMEFEMETAKKMHFWSSSLLAPIFIGTGVVGNILSIIIWNRKKMLSSTGTYLIGQAIADMGLLVFFFLTDSVPMIFPIVKTGYVYSVFYSYIGFPLFFWLILTSIWVTVGVTVDRYILVCWISKAKRMCSRRRAFKTVWVIAVICMTVNTPHFFTFRPSTVQESNRTEIGYTETEYGAGDGSRLYEFWIHCMLMVLGPWAIVFVLNILIIRQVMKVSRQVEGKKLPDKRMELEAQMTNLLLTVTFTFLVLLAFQCITQCFFMLEKGEAHIVSEAFSIAKLGVVINSSINFFLYCMSGRKFRQELLVVLSSCVPSTFLRKTRAFTLTSDRTSAAISALRMSASSVEEKNVCMVTGDNIDYTVTTKEKLPQDESSHL